MKTQTATQGGGTPPLARTLVASPDGEPRIILDEYAMELVARQKGLYEILFPLRRALDAAAVDAALKAGTLTSEDMRTVILQEGPPLPTAASSGPQADPRPPSDTP